MNTGYGYTVRQNRPECISLQCECGWVSPVLETQNEVRKSWDAHVRKHRAREALKHISAKVTKENNGRV